MPPIAPPRNIPINWKQDKIPNVVPLILISECLETKDGKLASNKLKLIKNKTNPKKRWQ